MESYGEGGGAWITGTTGIIHGTVNTVARRIGGKFSHSSKIRKRAKKFEPHARTCSFALPRRAKFNKQRIYLWTARIVESAIFYKIAKYILNYSPFRNSQFRWKWDNCALTRVSWGRFKYPFLMALNWYNVVSVPRLSQVGTLTSLFVRARFNYFQQSSG